MEKWFMLIALVMLAWNLREAAVIRRQREILRQFDQRARTPRVLP